MNVLFRTVFGSHVYGTNLPASDTDYKAIFIPSAKDIVLQRAKDTIVKSTKADPTARNTSVDVDEERFSLQRYLELLMDGQTVAIDMLFTPDSFHTQEAHPVWKYIIRNRSKLLSSNTAAFAGYCRTQAAKYGIKGSRIGAVRSTLDWLKSYPDDFKLFEIGIDAIHRANAEHGEHCSVVYIKSPRGIEEPHLEVVNRKIPLYATVRYAKSIFQKIFDQYGHRAKLAELNEGIDWKALMHAVRVADEAYELLTTGSITFPRSNRELLLKIRQGKCPYDEVATLIETGLERLEIAQTNSVLAAKPDRAWADELIYRIYLQEICL